MDLLANYGSDEEDEPAVPRSSGTNSFLSLPPPGASAQAVSFDEEPVKGKGGSSAEPKAERTVLPSDFFDGASVGPRAELSALSSVSFNEGKKVSYEEASPEVSKNPASLFSILPPPSSARLSLGSLPPPSKSKRKTVAFKPPVNLSLLVSTDEDDEERTRKRSKVSEVSKGGSGAKVGGLAALLPPPKNSLGSGVAFGGGAGGAGGRRATMETESASSKTTKDGDLQPSSGSKEGDNSARQPSVSLSETQMRVNPNNHFHYPDPAVQGHTSTNQSYSEPDVRIPEGNYAQEEYTPHGAFQNGGYQYYNADSVQQDYRNWQYPDASGVAAGSASANASSGPLAEVLQRERRKGKNEPPPQFIEVKQADLTAGRVREDQLRTTGIAFGPNYQPVSAGKDKPSKIHRRKHQIGALYFDMKSREMELLDRRSKGNLTKAETQAKYGW